MYTDAVLDAINPLELDEAEESGEVGSFNPGYLMVRLGVLFDRLDTYQG